MGLSRGSHSFFECSYANRYVIEVDLFGPMNMSNLCNVNSRAKAFFSLSLIHFVCNYFLHYSWHCSYQGDFQQVNILILINRAKLFNVKLILTESSFGKSYFKSDIGSWDIILRENLCRKVTFGFCPLLWSNFAIFDFDGHFFLSLNGRKDRQHFSHSCPQGWRKLTTKSCGTKLTNAVLKVWDVSTIVGHNLIRP